MTTTIEEHAHTWRISHAGIIAPTGPPPEHTMFTLLVCNCGAFDLFPRSNFDLVTPEFRAEFLTALAVDGLRLVEASS